MQESLALPTEPTQVVQHPPKSSRKKIGVFVLVVALLIAVGATAYYFWKRSGNNATSTAPLTITNEQGEVTAIGGKTFSESKNGVALPVQSCTPNQQVVLGTTANITFVGLKTLKAEPFCEMTLTANSRFGPAIYDCVFKLDGRPEIFLQLEEYDSDPNFIQQHCTVR